jgi:hypothetical protein
LGTEAALGEKSMSAFVGGKNLGAGLVLHEFDVDSVAVVIIKNKHVIVACTGGSEETSRLVRVDLAGDTLVRSKDMVRAWDRWGIWRITVRLRVDGRCRGGGRTDRGKLGGAKVSSLLVKVTLDHGGGAGGMLADLAGGKVRKGGEMA